MGHPRPLVAALLALAVGLAGCNGDDNGADAGDATTDIEVEGTDALEFDPDTFAVPAGEQVTVSLTSGNVEHDFVIEDVDGEDVNVVHADPNETATGTFEIADPGTYTVFCAVPGHREGGMLATLEVVDGG